MKKLWGLFLLSCLAVLLCFSRNMDALGSIRGRKPPDGPFCGMGFFRHRPDHSRPV